MAQARLVARAREVDRPAADPLAARARAAGRLLAELLLLEAHPLLGRAGVRHAVHAAAGRGAQRGELRAR